jgi:hypothetical protein
VHHLVNRRKLNLLRWKKPRDPGPAVEVDEV